MVGERTGIVGDSAIVASEMAMGLSTMAGDAVAIVAGRASMTATTAGVVVMAVDAARMEPLVRWILGGGECVETKSSRKS